MESKAGLELTGGRGSVGPRQDPGLERGHGAERGAEEGLRVSLHAAGMASLTLAEGLVPENLSFLICPMGK